MHNLMKIRNSGILCPEVVMLKKHVLLMSFIGIEGKPAPKLKEAVLNENELKDAYEQCIQVSYLACFPSYIVNLYNNFK